MTLDTRVYLRGPINPRHAFETAICVVLTAAGREGEAAVIDPDETSWRDGEKCLSTLCGQGLPAWTMCHYRPDGPVAPVDEYSDCDGECEPYLSRPACTVEISWDTTYGYRDNGLTCTRLHVLALIELRETLPAEVAMFWRNEYSGGINTELDGFEEFLGGGSNASAWFESIRPALESYAREQVSE